MNTDEKVKCVVEIPIEKITVNPYQPRKNFDRNALSELAQSIKEYGVIQPITVRNNLIGGYELIYGERRLRASKLAEKTKIPCIIIDADENESAIIAMLENVQRADLTFLEEADVTEYEEVSVVADDGYNAELSFIEIADGIEAYLIQEEGEESLRLVVLGEKDSKRSVSNVTRIIIE